MVFKFPMPIRDYIVLSDSDIVPPENYDIAKKGKKIKKRKTSKVRTSSQNVSQKVNIKIGSLEPKGDTAILHKADKMNYPIYPTGSQTYLRLEPPAFKYANPLPTTIPNLYQANPSSIANPLIPSQPINIKAKDLQPQKHVPIVQDSDPNDLQSNIRSRVKSGSWFPDFSKYIPSTWLSKPKSEKEVIAEEKQEARRPQLISPIPTPPYLSGYSTPAEMQEEYIAKSFMGPPGKTFINTRWLEQPQASQASSSQATNESLRIQRLQQELINPQREAQVIARNFFKDRQPITQLQHQLQPSQQERVGSSLSSREAGYIPERQLKSGGFV